MAYKKITEKLAGRRGAVVAIEPSTGGVLAFVSTPSFDPNPFVNRVYLILYINFGVIIPINLYIIALLKVFIHRVQPLNRLQAWVAYIMA
jgi:cell division protein FtsI/penicillin-binding protein 2